MDLSNIQFHMHYHEGFYSNISLKHNTQLINSNSRLSSSNVSPFNMKDSFRTVCDVVHHYMTFPEKMWKIIDTPEFQRLRNLKQLASSSWIYPGATHTRFEHCLGTGYLANDLVRRCFNSCGRENKYLIDCVAIAGLCHDIGHGPFSHSFNQVLAELNIGQDWEHEEFSGDIIKYLVDKNNIDMDNDMISLIHALISGNNHVEIDEPWIYQIVANKENSIDVDKFDYICRDIYHLGIHNLSVDYSRVFNDCKIIDNKICFNEKNDLTLSSIFEARFSLHKKVYKHNKNLCVNLMIKDALALSDDYFHFAECIVDPAKFLELDDNIIQIIKRFSKSEDDEINSNHKLLQAEEIIRKLDRRDIYKFIGEIAIPAEISYHPEVQDFISFDNPKDENYLTENDISIEKAGYDYGNKNKNPFDGIYFYNQKRPNECFRKLQRHSLLTPNVFREYFIKIICKTPSKVERATKVFELYKKDLIKKWGSYLDEEDKELLSRKGPLLPLKRIHPPKTELLNSPTPVKKIK